MKFLALVVLVVAAAAGSHGSSLLEMSQLLWSRVLDGGFHRVGRLDPLRVPVVKVDQSEGDTSYRVVLKNLEVRGLNRSSVESVHLARGSLKSNLSDSEAGYVSYNEQHGLDSIRYRFHTLVKERPPRPGVSELQESASEQFDRVVEYDPVTQKAQGEAPRRYSGDYQQQSVYNSTHRPPAAPATSYANMRVALSKTQQNPAQMRVVYSNSYPPQEAAEFVRPCVGACRRNQESVKGVKNPAPQQKYPGVNFGSPVYQDQPGVKVQYGQSQFSVNKGADGPRYSGNFGNGRFAVKGQGDGDNKPGFNVNYNGPSDSQFSVSKGQGDDNKPGFSYSGPGGAQFSANKDGVGYSSGDSGTRFSVKGQGEDVKPGFSYSGPGGAQFSANKDEVGYSYGDSGTRFSVKGQGEDVKPGFSYSGPGGSQFSANKDGVGYSSGDSGTRFSVKGQGENVKPGFSYSGPGGSQFSANKDGVGYSGDSGTRFSFNTGGDDVKAFAGEQPVKGGTYNTDRFGDAEDSASNNHETKVQFDSNHGFGFNFGAQRPANQERPAPINGDAYYTSQDQPSRYQFAEATTSAFVVEEFQPFKSPLIRLEKQPGYVDIVYSGASKRKGDLSAAASDPRYVAFDEDASSTELPENHSYNLTDGEPLIKKYKADADSKRIRDLERYAREYQEKQGYYEEGLELVYHFGNLNASGSNDTLNRRKRQHDKDEEDVMHVIVRIHVPELTVKSGYALTGKVGKQPVRGNGLLTGNFTDVIADFTVELKRVSNSTMVVRAARARLVCRDHKIKLQGMNQDDQSPVLSHGLMAAEAVAAMIADDLATKVVNEGAADATIYKMYKNLPK